MKTKSTSKIIGRAKEQEILTAVLKSKKAEFVALYGRRRVGKTYLIKNFFVKEPCLLFHATGLQDGSLKIQLEQFAKQIGDTFYSGASITPKKRWIDAFEELTKATQQIPPRQKMVLFLDEFPWMATKRSWLLQALDYYWNRYWVHDARIKLIICGSSASWLIEKIINNKGGLHNRVTRTMRLEPFNLHDTAAFLSLLGIRLNQKHVLELYMALGGIPHYLGLVQKGLSSQQAIDELCFQKDGALVDEFERLFASLFQESEHYISLLKRIAKHRYGIGQADLIREGRVAGGGRTVQRLKALEEAGFIISFIPYGHQEKGIYYKVVDEYTLFYLSWIKPNLPTIRKQSQARGHWLSKAQTSSWKSWSGLAFEAVCYKHLPQIQKALSISGDVSVGAWRYAPRNKEAQSGAQIDLLFDRSDNAVTLCEIKYTEQSFLIDKKYALNLLNKVEKYQSETRTKKQIFIAMITGSGLKPSMYSEEIISKEVTLEDLYRET